MRKIVLGLLMVLATGCTKDDKANDTNTTNVSSVKIGAQTWTTKNLDVATYSDGTEIPQITDPTQWKNLTTGAWCYYNNDSTLGTTYGKLYNWYAVAGIWNESSKIDTTLRKQLAPAGYHIPSDAEWITLTSYLGSDLVAGGKMKESGTTHWKTPNLDATNSSNFTALPGGFLASYESMFNQMTEVGYWWSSSEDNTLYAYGTRSLTFDTRYIGESYYSKKDGNSVRCIKD